MGPAAGRGRKSILPSSPRPCPSCGLQWGTRWAWLRWRLCPAGAPVERNPCPTPGASMSCTACAKVRLGLACLGREGPRGRAVSPAGAQRWEQERAIAPGFRPRGGPGAAMDGAFCCRTGKAVSSSKALAVARARGDGFLGSGLPSVLTPPLPPSLPPSDVFPGQMEGVKLVVNKVLSSHFQVLPLLWPPAPRLLPARPLLPLLLPGQAAGERRERRL